MGDNDKPFVCMQSGCSMRFTNEDHLSVHRLKHEMSLALTPGTKPGSFLSFADQTPTPTKFLKNCEEIGLFNELNKNPFEEAFKKASESIDVKSVESLHLPIAVLDPDTLHTPTPQMGIHVIHTPDVTLRAPSISKAPEFIPLPGPDCDMGSTIATTPGGSSMCGTPRSGSMHTPNKSTGTPAGTPTSSSTMGLPFKLKLKREPLGENELSMLPGGVVSPSVPKKSPISAPKDNFIKGNERPVDKHVTLARPANIAPNLFPSPTKIAMVTPTPMVSNVPVTSSANDVMTTVAANSIGGAITGAPLLVNNATSNAKNPQYFLQVMIQMPNGEMMPVQIPAALSTATTTSPVATPAVSTLAKSSAPITMVASTPAVSMATIVQQSGSGAASSLTKQKLKAALQQSVLSSNMRVMSEAVERISTDKMPLETTTVLQSTLTPLNSLQTTSAIRPQTLMAFPVGQQQSPTSSITTPLSPDMDYDLDYDEDDDDMDLSSSKKRRSDDDPDERRKKFLERNRAAAARCRMKKKTWITNLEKKADDLQNTNSKLQQEVTVLRSEVAQLKMLLLAHKDCPITLQLQSAGMMSPVTEVETQYNNISSTCQTPFIIDTAIMGDATSPSNCIPVTMATHGNTQLTATQPTIQPTTIVTMQPIATHATMQPTATNIIMQPIVIEIKKESLEQK